MTTLPTEIRKYFELSVATVKLPHFRNIDLNT